MGEHYVTGCVSILPSNNLTAWYIQFLWSWDLPKISDCIGNLILNSIHQWFGIIDEPNHFLDSKIDTVLGVSNVAWYISMSYAEWDNCEVEFCHGMCDRECHT